MNLQLFFLIWSLAYALIISVCDVANIPIRDDIENTLKSEGGILTVNVITILFAGLCLWDQLRNNYPGLTGGGGGY